MDRLVAGPDDATPLVLLHGFTGDSTTWRRLLPHLAADRTVLGVDLVGHGRSPAPDEPGEYVMATAVRDVLAAAHAAGVRRGHWLGYSMGGRVALSLAVASPEACSGLVLVGATAGIADDSARAARRSSDEALARDIEAHGLEAFVDDWMRRPLFASQTALGPAFVAEARAQRLRNDPHALARSLRGMGTGAMPQLWSALPGLRLDVLLVNGAGDTKFGALADAMAAELPCAHRLAVPGSGHAVHVEAPRSLGLAVRAFLHAVDEGRPVDPASLTVDGM